MIYIVDKDQFNQNLLPRTPIIWSVTTAYKSKFKKQTNNHVKRNSIIRTITALMNKIDIFLLITVNPFPPGHDREVVLELVTPIAVEGDPVGLHSLLLEGVAPMHEGDKHLLDRGSSRL